MRFFALMTILYALVGFGCNPGDHNQDAEDETIISGSTKMLADESLMPIVEDQLTVFQSLYPRVNIDMIYKPENKVLNLFLNDSIRVAILSRKLRPEESAFYEKKKIRIRVNRFAYDAIALITNAENKDTLMTVDQIKSAIRGETLLDKNIVFDNPNSSTVRYLKELAGVSALRSKTIYALRNNTEVIKYVQSHVNSIGIIGVNWLKQPTPKIELLLKEIKVMAVKNSNGAKGDDNFYKPSQSNIKLKTYPLIRELFIINCQGKPGLGMGFASFLASDRGQRIVLKSGLVPDSVPPRQIIIRK